MTDLCAIYDIARETGYYWLRRYQQGGLEALRDRGRAPERHPNQTPERIERAGVTEAGKRPFSCRLELVAIVCFQGVTEISNRRSVD